MNGYIDVHSHILPGVDDGSKDWDMTVKMLNQVYQEGVRTIVATPHNYPGERCQDTAKIRELYEQTQKLALEIAPDFSVLLGNEIYFRESIVEEIKKGMILTMADSDYLLVEFSPRERYRVIFQGIKDLVENGYIPIIAHVERVEVLIGSDEKLSELRKMGCYMQANAEDMIGGMFDRGAGRLRKLAENGYIHLLGSDCHNLTTRPPQMQNCMKLLQKKLSPEAYQRLAVTNPERFLDKKYI